MTGTDTIQHEYTAKLADGTVAELTITYSELGNYCTATTGKRMRGLSVYDQLLPFAAVQGGPLEMLHHLEQDKQLAIWNGGKPIVWQEVK